MIFKLNSQLKPWKFDIDNVRASFLSLWRLLCTHTCWIWQSYPQTYKWSDIDLHFYLCCSCWLEKDAFFGAVAAPILLIILVNIIAFIMVVKQLHNVSQRRGSTYSEANLDKRKNITMQIRGAIAVFVLLGLTWSMAGM